PCRGENTRSKCPFKFDHNSIKADDDKATWYFKRSSAISRTGYSEYWAGMMFLNGEEGFIEKNKQKALHWLNLSCMEGFDTGCEEFEKLTNG
ncbi:sel1 repeat family protein, partial [Escherichia coli]|nr:sel1 repeat family protein [Escherichia coli]